MKLVPSNRKESKLFEIYSFLNTDEIWKKWIQRYYYLSRHYEMCFVILCKEHMWKSSATTTHTQHRFHDLCSRCHSAHVIAIHAGHQKELETDTHIYYAHVQNHTHYTYYTIHVGCTPPRPAPHFLMCDGLIIYMCMHRILHRSNYQFELWQGDCHLYFNRHKNKSFARE